MNKALLTGRLGKDPEIRRTQAGTAVATFSMATSDRWTDKDTGEKKERTEWHRVVVFNEVSVEKFIEPHVHKGDLVEVEGEMRTRKYQDQGGNDKYITEVVVSQFRGDIRKLASAVDRPAPNEDEYGTTKTRESSGGNASFPLDHPSYRSPAGQGPLERPGFPVDDDIPF